jgi:hypothetical protein
MLPVARNIVIPTNILLLITNDLKKDLDCYRADVITLNID